MDDKTMLEGILWDLKVMGDLSLHGAIESGTKNINKTFKDLLMETLTLQNDLYTLMSDEGMYSVSNAPETKVSKTKSKFNPTLKEE